MKNKLFILIFLVLSSTLIFGQSIKVTNPGSKTILMKGDPVKITWVKQGRQNSYVKIRLFNSIGKRIASITDKTQNDGLFNWKLNIIVPAGKYFVRVKTVDNKVTGNSGLFQCGKSSSPPPPPPAPPKPDPPTPPAPPSDDKGSHDPNKIYQFEIPQYQLKDGQTKSNTITFDNKKDDKKEDSKKDSGPKPVILIFSADPKEIKNGEKYSLRYHYKNATEYAKLYIFKNRKKGAFVRNLPKGADISGSLEMSPVSWNDHEYLLEVANYKTSYSTVAKVKVVLDTKITEFSANKLKFNISETVNLHYAFRGAVKAYIKDTTINKIIKEIDPGLGGIVQGTYSFKFKKNAWYKLFIKEAMVNKMIGSDIIKISDLKTYGVKRWKVVHNWRFDGWHVDVNLHGFGFKYLKFFLFNTNTGKTKIVDEKKFTMYQEFTYNKLKVAVIPFSDEKYVNYGLYFEFMNGNSGYLYQDKEIK